MFCPHCGCPIMTGRSPRRQQLERQLADAITRAELAEAELANGHSTLTTAGIQECDDSGRLSITGRVIRLRQERDLLRRRLQEQPS